MAPTTANPLVAALATGQPAAFAALYDRLGRSMLRVAAVMLRSATEAEDVVQDVFVEIVRHRDRISLVADLDAYVFAMLRHAVGRRIQHRRREQHHLRLVIAGGEVNPDLSLSDDVETALGSLPTEQREVIALKIDAGLTFAQMGEILSVSPNTAASRYRYAIDKLRKCLE